MADMLPLLALHPSASSGAALSSVLGAACEDRESFAPDLPGYGASAAPFSSAVPNVAHDVEAVLGSLSAACHHVFGHGYGGLVALMLTQRAPERVASLTLFEPDAFRLLAGSEARDDSIEMNRLKAAQRHLERSLRCGRPDDGMALVTDLREGPGAWASKPPRNRDALAGMARRVEWDLSAALAAPVWQSSLSQVEVPVTVILGLESPVFAQRTAERA